MVRLAWALLVVIRTPSLSWLFGCLSEGELNVLDWLLVAMGSRRGSVFWTQIVSGGAQCESARTAHGRPERGSIHRW